MKGYFVLLAVLYLVTLLMNVWSLTHRIPTLLAVKNALDIALFALCLLGAYGLAFRRSYWEPLRWRMIYQATLVLGVFSVMIMGFGERFDMPTPYTDPSLLLLGMLFLPYLLFALPVILYEHALRKGFDEIKD